MHAGGVFSGKKHTPVDDKNVCVCVFSKKKFWKGWEEEDPAIYPPWSFFRCADRNLQGSSKSLPYGILDNLPSSVQWWNLPFPPSFSETQHFAPCRGAKLSKLENNIWSVSF